MSKVFGMLKSGAKDFVDDECMVSGAALAYYTIFSLPPLLVLVFFIAGLFGVSDAKINKVVSRQIGMPIPGQSQSADSQQQSGGSDQGSGESSSGEGASESEESSDGSGGFGTMAERRSGNASPIQSLGPVSKAIGILLLVFSATGVFAQLQSSLNRAWEVEPDPEQGGWKNFVFKRLLSLGMIVVIAFLLLVSLVLTTLVDELVAMVVGSDPGAVGTTIGILLNNLVALVLATLLFAAMYKILPDAHMRWKDMWIGAFITALLFVLGKEAIGWYLQNSAMGDAWGSAAASMIGLLVWVYYSSLIVLFGAELTQAWASRFGAGIVPDKGAVRVVQKKEHVR